MFSRELPFNVLVFANEVTCYLFYRFQCIGLG